MNTYSKSFSQAFSLPRTYLTAAGFVLLSVVVPQIMHQFSMAGTIFLPILFFTFFATVRFGTAVGLLSAFASPLVSNLLTGMPPGGVLYVMLAQCITISLVGGYFVYKTGKINLYQIAAVIVAYQIVGCALDVAFLSNFTDTLLSLKTTIPGMLIQLGFFTVYSRYFLKK